MQQVPQRHPVRPHRQPHISTPVVSVRATTLTVLLLLLLLLDRW